MKKWSVAALALCMAASLMACGAPSQKVVNPQICAGELTEQEENLVKLYGVEHTGKLFDYQVGEEIKSLQLEVWEWADGAWMPVSGGVSGYALEAGEGRLLIAFDRLHDGKEKRVALQTESGTSASAWYPVSTPPTEEAETTEAGFIRLSDPTEILCDRPVALWIEYGPSAGNSFSMSLSHFEHPERIEAGAYDYVYAVTVTFSEKTLGELSGEG